MIVAAIEAGAPTLAEACDIVAAFLTIIRRNHRLVSPPDGSAPAPFEVIPLDRSSSAHSRA
ncbi:MAG TPA: hypothetical protein VGH40_13185 [Roseiarcus sp.]